LKFRGALDCAKVRKNRNKMGIFSRNIPFFLEKKPPAFEKHKIIELSEKSPFVLPTIPFFSGIRKVRKFD
jgi:hypothetical protein